MRSKADTTISQRSEPWGYPDLSTLRRAGGTIRSLAENMDARSHLHPGIRIDLPDDAGLAAASCAIGVADYRALRRIDGHVDTTADGCTNRRMAACKQYDAIHVNPEVDALPEEDLCLH